jgi:hypothetical protein
MPRVQRKNIGNCKIEAPSYLQMQTHENYIRPLSRNSQSQESVGKIYIYIYPKKNIFQLRLLYPAKLSYKIDTEIRTFQDKHKLKQFINIMPT